MLINTKNNSTSIIKAELEGLSLGKSFAWGRTSRLADLIDRTGYWKHESSSFSAWLDKNSNLLGVKRSMLWRYISAGRFYNERLRQDFPDLAQKPLEQISDELSPENLELLSKIFRAAPTDLYKKLAVKLLTGEAKRSELRETWRAFKPILDGKTARGRGVTPPKAELEDATGDERLTAALMRNQLANSDASWTQLKNLSTHKVFTEINLSGNANFDLVVVTRGKTSALLMHGIEIVRSMKSVNHHMASQLKAASERCDQLWIALPAAPERSFADRIPDSIGILIVDSNGINTIRLPKRTDRAACTEELSRTLLELAIK